MNTISEEKNKDRNIIQEEAFKMRKENNRLIEFNRQMEIQKKKDIHN